MKAFAIRGLLASMIFVLLFGCSRSKEKQSTITNNFLKQADGLYGAYLAGDGDQAKQSLEKSIKLAEESKLVLEDRAHALMMDYQRLYVLERRFGDTNLAEAALLKAHYWLLEELESGNNSTDDAIEFVRSRTGDVIEDFVDRWDKKTTGGKGPKYLQSIKKH